MKQTWLFVGLVAVSGCSLALDQDDLVFDDLDAGLDGGPPAECVSNDDCDPPPGRQVACDEGRCVDLGCVENRGDCDGVVGNGCEVDLRTSPSSCGACGEACSFGGAAGRCEDGVCVLGECRPGFDNCDGDISNGCEADLSRPAFCGSCTNTCGSDEPLCDTSTAPSRCVADCGAAMLCDDTCADLDTSIAHCGACDAACPDVAGASPTCTGGECGYECLTDLADCNDMFIDGCEVTLSSDLTHCGACDNACAGGNASWTCDDGDCAVASCDAGYASCDASDPDCETDVRTSSEHCGGCGNVCDGSCVDGVCDPVVQGAAGWNHSCARRLSGEVWCWGDATFGQNGGRVTEIGGPFQILRVDDSPLLARWIAAGEDSTCAVDTSGELFCWGRGGFGALGSGGTANSSRAVAVTGDATFDALTFDRIASSYRSACALASDGSVWCWGDDTGGNLFPGEAASRLTEATAISVPPLRSIAAGQQHFCGIVDADGRVVCWGRGTEGQLGDGMDTSGETPVTATGLTGATALAAGGLYTCAIDGSGGAFCWGRNNLAQLGLGVGDRTDRSTPTALSLSGVQAIATAFDSACAVTSAGFSCWGRFNEGATALPSAAAAVETPTRVDDAGAPPANQLLGGATAPFAGYRHICAIIDGQPHCWGSNENGQLGTTDTAVYFTPATVDVTGATILGAGSGFGCALASGEVRCWGTIASGRTGFDLAGLDATATPTALRMPLTGVTDLAVGSAFGCAVHSGGLSCWGSNNLGQLGRSGGNSTDPVAVTLPALDPSDDWVGVAAGTGHACAHSMTGRVACWGENGFGQLGRTGGGAAPAFVTGLSDATALALGQYRTCALRMGGTVMCWGRRYDDPDSATPLTIQTSSGDLSDVTALAAGRFHNCAVSDPGGAGGTVWCWGDDNFAELGDETLDSTDVAQEVGGLSDAVSVAAGHAHSCAARAGGEVWCWGGGVAGELGDPARPDGRGTAQVVTGASATELFGGAFGAYRTFARQSDGTVTCFGGNHSGACGAGEPLYFSVAAPVGGLF